MLFKPNCQLFLAFLPSKGQYTSGSRSHKNEEQIQILLVSRVWPWGTSLSISEPQFPLSKGWQQCLPPVALEFRIFLGQGFWSVQLLSCVQFFVTPWTAAHQASLCITNSQSLLKLMSMKLVIYPINSSSVLPFSSCLQSFPASGSFPMCQFFASGGQSVGASAQYFQYFQCVQFHIIPVLVRHFVFTIHVGNQVSRLILYIPKFIHLLHLTFQISLN